MEAEVGAGGANGDEEVAGFDDGFVVAVDAGELAGGELEGDGFAFAGGERHAFETDEAEFVGGHARDGWAEIELWDFGAGACARVGEFAGHGDCAVPSDRGVRVRSLEANCV